MPFVADQAERLRTGATTGRNDVPASVAGGFPWVALQREPVPARMDELPAGEGQTAATVHVAQSRNSQTY